MAAAHTLPAEITDAATAATRSPIPSPIIHAALLNARSSMPPLARQLLESPAWCAGEHTDITTDDRASAFRRFDVAVLADKESDRPKRPDHEPSEQERQLDLLQQVGLGVLVLTRRPWAFVGCGAGVVCLPPDASIETAAGVLLALARVRPILRSIDRHMTNLNRLSDTLRHQFDATRQELQLASRLQRDFLPRDLPQTGPIRFATLFRPSNWVSGDIFDVFRLDERHWGFYIADAVGHGVAAGLLTMYIKHAIRPKRIYENSYELVAPAEVLATLNDQLASQDLPDSPFITGWYGMINVQTLELQYSVAGHPPPLVVARDGGLRELHGDGCILGLSCGETFSTEATTLQPGERVVLYSDGLEGVMISRRSPKPQIPSLKPGLGELLRAPAEELIAGLSEQLDNEPGSLTYADDVTVLVLDVLQESSCCQAGS